MWKVRIENPRRDTDGEKEAETMGYYHAFKIKRRSLVHRHDDDDEYHHQDDC
jgi:hypothetical protein